MNYSDIETFLTVVSSKNILVAAEKMFLAQSTVSSRIQALETELGVRLFDRSRGRKEVTLTPRGEEFLVYAQELMKTQSNIIDWLQNPPREQLKIGSVDSYNNSLFHKLYLEIIQDNSMYIEVSTYWSERLIEMVENETIDVALIPFPIVSKTIQARPVFREEMVIVSQSKMPRLVDIRDLNTENEVYYQWGNAFSEWHDLWFIPQPDLLIKVDTTNLLFEALAIKDSWAIVPINVVLHYLPHFPIHISRLSITPPARTCYLVHKRDLMPSKLHAIEKFTPYLFDFVNRTDYLIHTEEGE